MNRAVLAFLLLGAVGCDADVSLPDVQGSLLTGTQDSYESMLVDGLVSYELWPVFLNSLSDEVFARRCSESGPGWLLQSYDETNGLWSDRLSSICLDVGWPPIRIESGDSIQFYAQIVSDRDRNEGPDGLRAAPGIYRLRMRQVTFRDSTLEVYSKAFFLE